MDKLTFPTKKDFDEWLASGNTIYPFYDGWEERPTYFITKEEVDELLEYERRHGKEIIEQDDNGVYLYAKTNDSQYKLFCEAHCTDITIEYFLYETIALISADCWETMYAKLEDYREVVDTIVQLARKFEQQHGWFLFNEAVEDYTELLELFEEEEMKAFKESE